MVRFIGPKLSDWLVCTPLPTIGSTLIIGCVQDGATALHIASQNGHCEVVRMLLKAKANVNMKTNVSHAAWWCLCTLLIPWLSVCTVTSVYEWTE